jgi:hypothetical protein
LVCEQDAHILDGRDQVILDLLTPEPPPARTFEVVIIGRISKTALDQVLLTKGRHNRSCLRNSTDID